MKIKSSGKTLNELLTGPATGEENGISLIEKGKETLRAGLISDFASLFDICPDLGTLRLLGYTPTWNDGDECTHRQLEPIINGFERYSRRLEEQVGRLDEEAEEVVARFCRRRQHSTIPKAFGTNWQLDFTRTEDGSIEFELSEYDCEH
jgi:hypothetical protein